MPRQEVQDAIDAAKNLILAPSTSKAQDKVDAEKAFDLIQSDPNLNHDEKQEAFQAVVKAYVQHQYDNTVDKETLLRSNDAGSHFMTTFMNHYAQDYNRAVMDSAMLGAMETTLPPSFQNVENFGTIGSPLTDSSNQPISKDDMTAYDNASLDLAQKVLHTAETNISKLSPEARAFIQAATEPAKNANDAHGVNKIAANTLFLRGAMASLGTQGTFVRGSEGHKAQGALMQNASVLLQTYANFLGSNPGVVIQHGKTAPTKAQDAIVGPMRTQEALDQSKELFTALGTGGTAVNDFAAKMERPVELSTAEKAKVAELEKAYAKAMKNDAVLAEREIGASLDKVTKLQARVERLQNNPTLGDRFKAFFQGGLNRAIDKTQAEITVARDRIADTIEQNKGRYDIDDLIKKNEGRQKALETLSDTLSKAGAEDYLHKKQQGEDVSGMRAEKDMVKQYQKNEGKVSKTETRVETLKSVRDELEKRKPKVEAPKVDGNEVDSVESSLKQSKNQQLVESGGHNTLTESGVKKVDGEQVPVLNQSQKQEAGGDVPKVGEQTVDDTSVGVEKHEVELDGVRVELPPLPKAPNKITSKIEMFEELTKQGQSVGERTGIHKPGVSPPKDGQKQGQGQGQSGL